jgi:CRISPR-associated exonuclease Cas4
VEYKRGRPKTEHCDRVQLCAQAICLEEMLETIIPEGALFYGAVRRREDVPFDQDLRSLTESTAEKLHSLINRGITPPAVYEKRCESCSLLSHCLPKTAGQHKSAVEYLKQVLE